MVAPSARQRPAGRCTGNGEAAPCPCQAVHSLLCPQPAQQAGCAWLTFTAAALSPAGQPVCHAACKACLRQAGCRRWTGSAATSSASASGACTRCAASACACRAGRRSTWAPSCTASMARPAWARPPGASRWSGADPPPWHLPCAGHRHERIPCQGQRGQSRGQPPSGMVEPGHRQACQQAEGDAPTCPCPLMLASPWECLDQRERDERWSDADVRSCAKGGAGVAVENQYPASVSRQGLLPAWALPQRLRPGYGRCARTSAGFLFFFVPAGVKRHKRRVELVQLLIDEARRMYPDTIRFHFEHPCDGWDLDAHEVHVASVHGQASKAGACSFPAPAPVTSCIPCSSSGSCAGHRFQMHQVCAAKLAQLELWHAQTLTRLQKQCPAHTGGPADAQAHRPAGAQARFDLLVAADGAGSLVRNMMASQLPNFSGALTSS